MIYTNEEQLAGIAEIKFYLLDETANWPFVVTDQNASQITFTPFENDVQGNIEPDSIKVNINAKETAEGIINQIDIRFKFITRSESLEQLLEQYQNKPGVAIGNLNNGFRKLYGTNSEPIYMTFEVDEGSKIDGAAATEVRLKGETRSRPVYYTV